MNNPISTRPSSGTFSVTFRRNDNPPQDHTAVQLSQWTATLNIACIHSLNYQNLFVWLWLLKILRMDCGGVDSCLVSGVQLVLLLDFSQLKLVYLFQKTNIPEMRDRVWAWYMWRAVSVAAGREGGAAQTRVSSFLSSLPATRHATASHYQPGSAGVQIMIVCIFHQIIQLWTWEDFLGLVRSQFSCDWDGSRVSCYPQSQVCWHKSEEMFQFAVKFEYIIVVVAGRALLHLIPSLSGEQLSSQSRPHTHNICHNICQVSLSFTS